MKGENIFIFLEKLYVFLLVFFWGGGISGLIILAPLKPFEKLPIIVFINRVGFLIFILCHTIFYLRCQVYFKLKSLKISLSISIAKRVQTRDSHYALHFFLIFFIIFGNLVVSKVHLATIENKNLDLYSALHFDTS